MTNEPPEKRLPNGIAADPLRTGAIGKSVPDIHPQICFAHLVIASSFVFSSNGEELNSIESAFPR
jgi:hypothetical protein